MEQVNAINGDVFIQLTERYTNVVGEKPTVQIMKNILTLSNEYQNVDLLYFALQYSKEAHEGKFYPYMKAILDNWTRAGLKTVQDVEAYIQKREEEKKAKEQARIKKVESQRYNPVHARKELVPEWLVDGKVVEAEKRTTLAEEMTAEHKWLMENITMRCSEDKALWTLEELRKVYKIQEMIKQCTAETERIQRKIYGLN